MKKTFKISIIFLLLLILSSCMIKDIEISFNTDGGNHINSIILDENFTLKDLEIPIKEGYDFLGWYLDPNFEESFFNAENIKRSVTLYAKWEKISELDLYLRNIYKLAYESNSFSGTYEEWLETVKGPKGEDAKDIEFSVKDGYIVWNYIGENEFNNLVSLLDITGSDGKEVEFDVTNDYIRWRYKGSDTYINLISLDVLRQGPKGDKGDKGDTGESIELRISNGYIQYSVKGTNLWNNLIQISELKGPKGDKGDQGNQGNDGVQGPKGNTGDNIELRVDSNYIQWKAKNDTSWNNLISLSALSAGNSKSAYETYLEYYPNYEGNEETWINDLINGKLKEEEKVYLLQYTNEEGFLLHFEYVKEGEDAIGFTPKEIEGYEFIGWDHDLTNIMEDLRVEAIYDSKKNKVFFIGFEGRTHEGYVDPFGRAYQISTSHERGYKFLGWYTEDDELFDFDTVLTENITLYGKWENLSANINSIRDILHIRDRLYNPSSKDQKIEVTLNNVTAIAKGKDTVFVYDGTGILYIYQSVINEVEIGKTYKVTGLLNWYYGLWQFIDAEAIEVEGTPQVPEALEINNVLQVINEWNDEGMHLIADGNVEDGNFEPIYARVTGEVYIVPYETSNYNTYLIDSNNKDNILGSYANPAKGILIYNQSNDLNYIRSHNGLEITIDVIIYTYRSSNYAYGAYYIGGPDGVQVDEMSEEEKIEVDFNSISIESDYVESAKLDLITKGKLGTNFVWSYTYDNDEANGLIDLETGQITPIEGELNVLSLTVTGTYGNASLVKTYEITVGGYNVLSIESILNGDFINGDPIRVVGVLLGSSTPTTYYIADETGGLSVFVPGGSSLQEAFESYEIGTVLDLTGEYLIFNNSHQITEIKMHTHRVLDISLDYPDVVDISNYPDLSTKSLKDLHGLKVKLEGLTLKEDIPNQFKSFMFVLVRDDDSEIIVRFDPRNPHSEAVYNHLKDYKAGDVLNISGLVASFFNNPQLVFVDNPFT